MKINGNLWPLVAVAGLAYAAGHFGVLRGGGSGAWGEAPQEAPPAAPAYRDVGSPGEHHRRLEPLTGEWDGEFKTWTGPDAPPMLSRGTISREWILGGRFLKETVEAESSMGAFRGLGYIGYNSFDGRYETVWMDDTSTAIYTETGTYHPDQKLLHTRSSRRDPTTGRLINGWGKLDLSDADRHTYVGYSTDADGRTFKAFEGVTERK